MTSESEYNTFDENAYSQIFDILASDSLFSCKHRFPIFNTDRSLIANRLQNPKQRTLP